MVPNGEGDILTPSAVLFGDDEVVVGKQARAAAIMHPDRVAQWVKRDMGSPAYSRPVRGRLLPPEVVQACILRRLRVDLERSLGGECRVVITVPAYFDELRRKATADAGEMAGLNILDIVNEPTAGALAFGEAMGFLSPGGVPRDEMNVMVYDLGGGTFDVTLLKLAPGNIQTIATDGDVQLGGYDWDVRLVDYAAEAFLRSYGVDPRQDPLAANRLMASVIEAKHTLSARQRATIFLLHAGQAAEIPVTRQQFEEMTADLLERTSYTCRQLLAVSGMQWKDVSRVLLVGGSTRMPMVSRMLQEVTGLAPDHSVNPDEAVARGAALYAAFKIAKDTAGSAPPSYQVTNVNAHSLGVEGTDPDTLRRTNVILLRRNTALPANVTERFMTRSEGQRSIVIKVLEGESSLPGECTPIGRTVVRDLPEGLPKAWPVDVTFEYAANGRLTVHAAVPGTHKQARLELERDVGLSGEGLSRWKRVVDTAAGFGTFETMVLDLLATLTPSAEGGSDITSGIPASGAGSPPAASAYGTAGAAYPAPMTGYPAAAYQGAVPYAADPAQTAAMAAGIPMVPAAFGAMAPTGTQMPPGTPGPPAAAGQPERQDALPRKRKKSSSSRAANQSALPPWLVNIAGHVLAALIGLGLGYLVLSRLRPDVFPLPW